MLFVDVECYRNYFLVLFSNGQYYEVMNGRFDNAMCRSLYGVMEENTTCGFNSLKYDLPMIYHATAGYTTEQLKELSDGIILHEHRYKNPIRWDHIDISEPAPAVKVSLKLYGGRMHSKRLQDLPIEPDAIILPEQTELLRKYCANDVRTTIDLYNSISKQIKLRCDLSAQYGQDLRSKSDAQIAEAVLVSELGGDVKRPEIEAGTTYKYDAPPIPFQDPILTTLLSNIKQADFVISDKGQVMMPETLDNRKIPIGNSVYKMGIGGLHSTEKWQTVKAENGRILMDIDVASYYPSIILNSRLYPEQFGEQFLDVYKSIVDRRLEAKRNGDKVVADSLKITINGSFGKFGSPYSKLYAPKLLIQTTVTGQLCLLWLIEIFESNGIPVVSGNTDGVVINPLETELEYVRELYHQWEETTGFILEETRYTALYSRDVNNYIAVKPDGSTKRKGTFANAGLMKNTQMEIVNDAIADRLSHGVPIGDTIYCCEDIRKFLTVRTVKGGGVWRDEYLGKVVRWYWSTDGEQISYKSNGNKVATSDGAKPLMELVTTMPEDIDYQRYVDAAEKIIINFH